MSNTALLEKAEKAATDILKNELSLDLSFHGFDHTESIVSTVRSIIDSENLSDEEVEIVMIAAWFQDTGFRDAYEGHEEKSVEIVKTFLAKENVGAEKIKQIEECILSTKLDVDPRNKLEKILHDAGRFYLAKGKYRKYVEGLREELASKRNQKFTDKEWISYCLEYITKFRFLTDYGKKKMAPERDTVRLKLQKYLNKLDKEIDEELIIKLGVTAAELKSLKKKLQKAEGRPERGIETMFRLTSKNHIDLSGMADSKANIMISVNSIIISIILGSLMQKLDSNQHLIYPTIILLTVNLGSMIFSILSLRPNVSNGLFTREDIENQKTNLLFFGNFHKMKREDYHWGMNKLMENSKFLYSNLIDDIYFLGVVLAKKYKFLRVSYNIFMYGVVVAVLAFIISIFFAEEPLPDTIIKLQD